ncbi:hypothetical protein [Geminocystis herdmanii]|uniref:hypothetical protein n=1 Tax=Geminocystis herdmanii TaxID=669359 RepID=UPI000348F023|nr:hypothetical protein [Geminocystis herdmanii]
MTIITVKRSEIPPMTEQRMKEIIAIPDEDIDYSDIPELDDDFFKNAQSVNYAKAERYKPITKRK